MEAKSLIFSIIISALVALLFAMRFLEIVPTLFFSLGLLAGIALLVADQKIFVRWYQLPYVFSKSFLFLFVYVPLSLFVVTSSGSLPGIGMMIGIAIGRVINLLEALQSQDQVTALNQTLLTGGKPLELKEGKIITLGLIGLLVFFVVKILI